MGGRLLNQGLILTSYEDDEALFAAGQSMLDPAVTQRVMERIRSGVEQRKELKSLSNHHEQPRDRHGKRP